MKYLYLVCWAGGDSPPSYYSTNSKELALDKADEWLLDIEEADNVGEDTIDVLRLAPEAPYTIERWDAIHNKWEG